MRGGQRDYKEEVNGKYTLSDRMRGRHSFAAPLVLPSPAHSPPLPSSPLLYIVGPWENQTGGLGLAGKLAGPGVGRTTGCWGLSKALRPSFRPAL